MSREAEHTGARGPGAFADDRPRSPDPAAGEGTVGEDAGAAADPMSLPIFASSPVGTGPEREVSVSPFALPPLRARGRPGSPGTGAVAGDGSDGGAPEGGAADGVDTVAGGRSLVEAQRRIDWGLVAALRSQASQRLAAARAQHGRLSREDERELGRAIILELLQGEAAELVAAGRESRSVAADAALARAVFDALFGLGRLQPLVDDDRVENIVLAGADAVWLDLVDGSRVPGPAVADSDEELVEFLAFAASRSQVNSRPFSAARPLLHLRLDGGARLAAAAWVTPRPSVVIRRHRLRRVSLADLVAAGSMSATVASLLGAAVRARRSIVVSGAQGAGKTTLVRALCAEIPRHEAIGTFETEYELHLHELADQHEIVHAFEARPGSGERDGDGRQAGEVTLADLLDSSFRFNLSRQIVGEVRGPEIWPMIKAMESGSGSISTTHASDAAAAIRKLESCAMEAGIGQDVATRKLTQTIDLVVHLGMQTTPLGDGAWRRSRWVCEVLLVEPSDEAKGYATTRVFRPARTRPVTEGGRGDGGRGPGGAAGWVGGWAVAGTLPDSVAADLVPHGFDHAAFLAEADAAREAGS